MMADKVMSKYGLIIRVYEWSHTNKTRTLTTVNENTPQLTI